MNRITYIVLLLLMFVGTAHADKFQFFYERGEDTYRVTHSKVQIFNANNEMVFQGFTDRYGRISIDNDHLNGEYRASVFYRDEWWRAVLVFNGSNELKRVKLE